MFKITPTARGRKLSFPSLESKWKKCFPGLYSRKDAEWTCWKSDTKRGRARFVVMRNQCICPDEWVAGQKTYRYFHVETIWLSKATQEEENDSDDDACTSTEEDAKEAASAASSQDEADSDREPVPADRLAAAAADAAASEENNISTPTDVPGTKAEMLNEAVHGS